MLELNIQLGQAFDHQSSPLMARGGCLLRETIYRDSARYAADALAHAADSTPAGHMSAPVSARSPQDAFESLLTNTLVHTWDLAQAIQIDFDPPRPDILDITLDCLRRQPPDKKGAGKVVRGDPGLLPRIGDGGSPAAVRAQPGLARARTGCADSTRQEARTMAIHRLTAIWKTGSPESVAGSVHVR